jgi:uncharacterized membrane protein YdjX (TVP38/TMEM64 family)
MRPRANAARLIALGFVAAGIVAAWRWRGWFDPTALSGFIDRNPAAPAAFVALHIVASLVFVPRTLMAVVAGLVFGAWWGVLWAALGSVLGAVAGFLLARYIHSGLLDPKIIARIGSLLARAERGGWRMVAVLRLVPIIPHSLTNYALGLTRLKLGAYAFGSLLGQLPLTIAYVDLGAAGGRALLGAADWLLPSAVGASALALSLLIPLLARRFRPVEAMRRA